jgi:dTDP-4-dehydrorhamnose 3,5-epimerase
VIFHPTAIPGIISIEASPARDERGAFMRSWCRESFATAGIEFTPIQ